MAIMSSPGKPKGNRRIPLRQASARKQKPVEWHKQATHRSDNPAEVPAPHVTLPFPASWERPLSENVYRLDQELARRSISYYAKEGEGWADIDVIVNTRHGSAVREIIRDLTRRYSEPQSLAVRGWWYQFEPRGLSRQDRDHPWTFASYTESGSERDDNMNYTAFLFADEGRTVFGIHEWLSPCRPDRKILEKMAFKVIRDEEYRMQLISDDPDLPLMWKGR